MAHSIAIRSGLQPAALLATVLSTPIATYQFGSGPSNSSRIKVSGALGLMVHGYDGDFDPQNGTGRAAIVSQGSKGWGILDGPTPGAVGKNSVLVFEFRRPVILRQLTFQTRALLRQEFNLYADGRAVVRSGVIEDGMTREQQITLNTCSGRRFALTGATSDTQFGVTSLKAEQQTKSAFRLNALGDLVNGWIPTATGSMRPRR